MANQYLRKYGTQTTIDFELYDTDGASLQTGAVHAAGDSKIMKDEAAEANTANAFTDEGQGYSIVLSVAEMQAARIVIYIVDQTNPKIWLDQVLIIETYGNASAMHAFDLDTATQDVNITSIDNNAITAASINTDAFDADAIATSGAQEIADETLKRGVSNVEASADTHSLATVILGMTEWEIVGANWVIYRTDHITVFATKPITTNAAADPITEVD